jgi:hypothetical protein
MKLFMVLIGCKPVGRHTEQHDVFFGIANELKELIPAFERFWPEASGNMHIDGYREIKQVNGYDVSISSKLALSSDQNTKLFFINLGGYKKNEFEEFHYKMIVASEDKSAAIALSKQTAFFKHTHFEGANSHIDDKYGIDVDDLYQIEDILDAESKLKYSILLSTATTQIEDELHLGYFKLNAL